MIDDDEYDPIFAVRCSDLQRQYLAEHMSNAEIREHMQAPLPYPGQPVVFEFCNHQRMAFDADMQASNPSQWCVNRGITATQPEWVEVHFMQTAFKLQSESPFGLQEVPHLNQLFDSFPGILH